MTTNRRDFLSCFLAAAATLPFNQSSFPSKGKLRSVSSETAPQIDAATLHFWSDSVREPSRRFRATGSLPETRGAISGHTAAFLFYSKKEGFRRAESTGDQSTIDRGAAQIALAIDAFRPSQSDLKQLRDLGSGSLRIDLQQNEHLPYLSERLAWSYIGCLLPAQGAQLTYSDFSFDPKSTWGKLQMVPLPGGIGFWTWNFFVQRRAGIWGRMCEVFKNGQKALASIGLPAIAEDSLQAVDKMLGYLQAHEESKWMLKSEDVIVYATKQARDMIPGRALALRSGSYLIVPVEYAGNLEGNSELELRDGLVVPKGTKSSDLAAAARATLPGVSYISASVRLRPLSA